MSPAEFEPATPVSNLTQTLALDRSATGIGLRVFKWCNLSGSDVCSEKRTVRYGRFRRCDAVSVFSFPCTNPSVYLSASDFSVFMYVPFDACFVYRSLWRMDIDRQTDRQLTVALPHRHVQVLDIVYFCNLHFTCFENNGGSRKIFALMLKYFFRHLSI